MKARKLVTVLEMLGPDEEVAISVDGALCAIGTIDMVGNAITIEAAGARPHELHLKIGRIRELATAGQASGITGGAVNWRNALEQIERAASALQ